MQPRQDTAWVLLDAAFSTPPQRVAHPSQLAHFCFSSFYKCLVGKKLRKECDLPTLLPTADRARAGTLHCQPATVRPRSPLPGPSSWTLAPTSHLLLWTLNVLSPISTSWPPPCHSTWSHPSRQNALPFTMPSALPTSHLHRLCAFPIDFPPRRYPVQSPVGTESGTADSQSTLAGRRLGFCCQPHSLMESTH